MSTNENLPKSYFEDKWYIREDLHPEMFKSSDRSLINCNIMFQIGNCFGDKLQALEKCNAIRSLLNVPILNH